VRLLHVTDTHLGARLYARGAPPDWCRADDHLAALERALQPAREGAVDLVVHTGDLFDRSQPPADARLAAAELLESVARQVPVVVIAGNHDRHGVGRSVPGRGQLHVVDDAAAIDVGGLRLAAVAYKRTAEAFADGCRRAWGGGADLLLCHQSFDGVRVGRFTFRVGRQRDTVGEEHLPAAVRHVLCGHIHPRQDIRVGGATVVHPGSTERTAFSEAGERKGYAVWELSDRVRWRRVDLPVRPMVLVRGPEDLARVEPGVLVRVDRRARQRGLLDHDAGRLGGWVVGKPGVAPGAPPPRRARPALPLLAAIDDDGV
jgi:DNA repair exonuclease SbcCD nuclease subunit